MAPNQYALTEPGVRAILARLEDPAQLNVEIANIAAGVSAADQSASLVPVPAANINDFVPPPSYLVDFPAIGIQDMGSKFEDDTGSSLTGYHRFGVVIFCSNPDQELLAWMLRRYAQAVVRVLLAQRSFPETNPPMQAGWGTGLDSIAWGPTLGSTATPKTWMSWCVVSIWTRREEI
jgi:hypothetical protein